MRFSLCRVDDRPDLLHAPGPGGRGGRLRLDGHPRQHLLPEDVRQPLPLQPRRDPGVPRRQALHRAVLTHPGPRGGHRADPLHHLRAQAADPPPGARGQAGDLDRGPHGRPAGPRRGHQPVARGLRDPAASRGSVGAGGWTRRSTSSAASRRGGYFEYHGEIYDVPSIKMCPGRPRAAPDPDRRPRRRRAAPGGEGRRRLAARRRRPRDLPAPARSGSRRCAASTARPTATFEVHVDLHGRLQRRRSAPAGGPGRHRRDRRLPLALRGRARHRASERQDRQAPRLRRLRHSPRSSRHGHSRHGHSRHGHSWQGTGSSTAGTSNTAQWRSRDDDQRGDRVGPGARPAIDGGRGGDGPRGLARPVRGRRRGGGPDRHVALRPRGQGPPRARRHRSVLRQRARSERRGSPSRSTSPSSAATSAPTSAGSARPCPAASTSRSCAASTPTAATAEGKLAALRSYWEFDQLRIEDA